MGSLTTCINAFSTMPAEVSVRDSVPQSGQQWQFDPKVGGRTIYGQPALPPVGLTWSVTLWAALPLFC